MSLELEPATILGLLIVLVVSAHGCAGRAVRPVQPPATVESASEDDRPAALVAAHNAARARMGLQPVRIDPRLAAAAERHARDMAARHKMSHRGGDGSSPFDRMEQAGYHGLRMAENIAWGDTSIPLEGIMRGWLRSPPHRRNIRGPYSRMGAAAATADDGTTYWCVTFGEPFDR